MLPHNDLILAVPVSADNLINILGPRKIAHLTACSVVTTVSTNQLQSCYSNDANPGVECIEGFKCTNPLQHGMMSAI